MCNALERSTADITIIIDGLAASMGAIFILSSKKVKIVNNGYVMIHAPHSGSYGNAKDHESNAKLLRLMEDNIVDKLMLRTGKTEIEVRTWISADTWLSAKEALALGLVSEIIPASVEAVYPAFDPEDVGETEAYNMYAALLTSIPVAAVSAFHNYEIPKNFNDNMKQLLITALALTGLDANSSDSAVLAAVQEKINSSEKKVTDAEAKLKSYQDSRITGLVASAENPNKPFTPEEKNTYQIIGETSGIEALEMVLKNVAKPAAPAIGALIQTGTPGASMAAGRDAWDFDQWQKEDPKGLEKLASDDKEKFQTLFNAKYKK